MKMLKIFVVVISCITLVSALCPEVCQCPPGIPVCAAGVNLILDTCGCCKVCARQLYEDCSKTQPCDTAKGLECNFGGGSDLAPGICRAKSDGRNCEFNSRMYQNGETFQPNCKYKCTCMNGSVGCFSLCTRELSVYKVGCANPKRVKLKGQCCEQLICVDDENTGKRVSRKRRRKHNKKQSEDDLSNKKSLHVWRRITRKLRKVRTKERPSIRFRRLKVAVVARRHSNQNNTASVQTGNAVSLTRPKQCLL